MNIKRFTHGMCQANAYILSDEKTGNAVMFDSCGCNDKIIKYLNENKLSLKAILLTHGHFDHIDGLSELKNITGADVYIFSEEEKFLSDSELNLSYNDADFDSSLQKADYLLSDGEKLCIAGMEIQVIHTPGHTSGSVCFKCGDCLFSGDTLFMGSIGRFDFPTGDGSEEVKSIKERLLILENDVKVYPGHGFSTTIGKEREENPYLCG